VPRYLCYLRIAFSALCGIACVLFAVLWVRSYTSVDVLSMPITAAKQIGLWSGAGRVEIFLSDYDATRSPWSAASFPREQMLAQVKASGKNIDTRYFGLTAAGFRFPIFLLALMAPVVAALPWVPWRFSLRTLLVVTTLVAALLGAIIYATRG
jgi:hypothetical protein